jgi:hypothetical protein
MITQAQAQGTADEVRSHSVVALIQLVRAAIADRTSYRG